MPDMFEESNAPYNDESIIDALLKNKIEAAVECLYEQYFDEVIEYIVFRGGLEDDGADIFQESILGLIDLIKDGKFRGESSIRTILFAIVRNRWHKDLRTRERRRKREELYSMHENESWDAIPDDITVNNIYILLDRIGETCKNILIGFYFESKSMRTLLEEYDFKNEQVLRNRKGLCMKKLKELLMEDKTLLQNLKSEYKL
jgi:RNA polymerase sigma factor (sigma-70 family)